MLDSLDSAALNAFMTLTQRDLDEIEKIVDERVDDKISHLPTKEDFYQKMDELIGELKGMREDFAVISGKVYDDHEPRIVKIERKLRIQPSS
jgi:soluble cytochrome b562